MLENDALQQADAGTGSRMQSVRVCGLAAKRAALRSGAGSMACKGVPQ